MQHLQHALPQVYRLAGVGLAVPGICQLACLAPDLGRLVANAFEVRHHSDDSDNHAQVAGCRLPAGQYLGAAITDFDFQVVHLVIGAVHLRGELRIALEQRLQRLATLLFHQATHGEHPVAHCFQFGVIALGGMLIQFHIIVH